MKLILRELALDEQASPIDLKADQSILISVEEELVR